MATRKIYLDSMIYVREQTIKTLEFALDSVQIEYENKLAATEKIAFEYVDQKDRAELELQIQAAENKKAKRKTFWKGTAFGFGLGVAMWIGSNFL